MTQTAAAARCYVSVAAWRNWEKCRRFMPNVAWAYFIQCVYLPRRAELKKQSAYVRNVDPVDWDL